MSDPWAALRGIRLGCVKYLNSRPLICDYDGPVIFEHPSQLAAKLVDGSLDAALVPIFETLRTPRFYLVDGAAVACDGPVYSVYLAHRGPLSAIRSVALDPASLTSVHLMKVLLAEFHGLTPEYGREGEAQLLIGNQAIEFRMAVESDPQAEPWQFLDLGAEWKRCTGLPFVFALWALREDFPGAANALRRLKESGVRRIPELVRDEPFGTPEMRAAYLSTHIRYDLGEAEKAAVNEYRRLLTKHGFIATSAEPLRWLS